MSGNQAKEWGHEWKWIEYIFFNSSKVEKSMNTKSVKMKETPNKRSCLSNSCSQIGEAGETF